MVSVPHANKHLIKFLIALDYTTLRSRKDVENSTTPPQTVLVKADTGADVNLMNRQTFSQLFGKAKVLQLWKFSNKSAWNVPCISEMEGQGLQTTFMLLTVTDLLTCCQGMLVTHLEFLSLVTPWKIPQNVTQEVNIYFIRK